MDARSTSISAPLGLLAELTHRCPLGCPYCSNPIALVPRRQELETAVWTRVFREAGALGVLHVHLSGGEPAARHDLVALTASARQAGLYTNLITSGVGLTDERLLALRDAGLDHLQLSVQDSDAASADRIARYRGGLSRKRKIAAAVVKLGIPLTINAVIHRANIGRLAALVDLALGWGATRVEIAHAQYHGWAQKNRATLMPSRAQVERAAAELAELTERHRGRIVIDSVISDYHARYPKPCVGGWGRRSLNVTPSGLVLPCHAAETLPGLAFWSVREHSLADIWTNSPAFRAFRGFEWMQEPCRSCARKHQDFGGCRCQAFALTGDTRAADPVCRHSPHHSKVAQLAAAQSDEPYVYRELEHCSDRTLAEAPAEVITP
jgi:pyrroloquinoline quinone biosynthesis protein E